MAKVAARLKAEVLRKQGLSISEIAREVNASKASISSWCRNVQLTNAQKELVMRRAIEGGHRGRILGAATNHRRKMERIAYHEEQGRQCVGSLSARELLFIGTALYWGEGSKKSRLSFINSDKDMVLFMFRWFKECLGVKNEDFMPRVFINAIHEERRRAIEKYLAALLGLPAEQFRHTTFIKRENTKKYSNHDTYFGQLSLQILNSNEIKYKILGLIEGLKHSTL